MKLDIELKQFLSKELKKQNLKGNSQTIHIVKSEIDSQLRVVRGPLRVCLTKPLLDKEVNMDQPS